MVICTVCLLFYFVLHQMHFVLQLLLLLQLFCTHLPFVIVDEERYIRDDGLGKHVICKCIITPNVVCVCGASR